MICLIDLPPFRSPYFVGSQFLASSIPTLSDETNDVVVLHGLSLGRVDEYDKHGYLDPCAGVAIREGGTELTEAASVRRPLPTCDSKPILVLLDVLNIFPRLVRSSKGRTRPGRGVDVQNYPTNFTILYFVSSIQAHSSLPWCCESTSKLQPSDTGFMYFVV